MSLACQYVCVCGGGGGACVRACVRVCVCVYFCVPFVHACVSCVWSMRISCASVTYMCCVHSRVTKWNHDANYLRQRAQAVDTDAAQQVDGLVSFSMHACVHVCM